MSPSSPHLVKTKHQESNEETKGQNAQNNPSQGAGGSRKEVKWTLVLRFIIALTCGYLTILKRVV